MSETDLTKSDQHIEALLLQHGWVKQGDIDDARSNATECTFEQYLHQNKKLTDKQLAETTLHRNLSEQVAGYDVEAVVGAGAMGVVYLARNDEGQQVALKVINKKHCDDEEFIKRFQRETDAVSIMKHENLVGAIDAGQVGEEMYLATEYVNGPSLTDILNNFGPLPEAYVLRCMKHVATGLEYAYNQGGIVHRDIKPPNILIQHGEDSLKSDVSPNLKEDIAKVIDFGLAKQTDDTENLTMTGLTVGTPHYMAPEQIRAESDIDCRADIYSIGATMYHLLTGKTPFTGKSPGAIMLSHVNDPIPDPRSTIPSLKEETVSVVSTCLAKDREIRFANYPALLQAIDRAIEALGTGSKMNVLRKPMVVNSAKLKKKTATPTPPKPASPVPETTATPKNEQADAGANTEPSPAIPTAFVEADKKDPPQRVDRTDSYQDELNNKIINESAAFDKDIEGSLGVGKWVWIALAGSIAFMLLALSSKFL